MIQLYSNSWLPQRSFGQATQWRIIWWIPELDPVTPPLFLDKKWSQNEKLRKDFIKVVYESPRFSERVAVLHCSMTWGEAFQISHVLTFSDSVSVAFFPWIFFPQMETSQSIEKPSKHNPPSFLIGLQARRKILRIQKLRPLWGMLPSTFIHIQYN